MRLRAGTRSNEYIALILGYLIIAVLLVALFSSGFIRISTSPSQSPSQVSTIFIFNASKTIELTGGGAVGALNEFKQFSLSNT
ncbi:MAG: hypothetical protein ACREBQ_07985, partial [Nitrososphaerales archaeon]